MIFRVFPYFTKQAISNILNNMVVHAIGMGTMVVSLLIFGTFLLLFVNLNTWVQGWGQSISMSVYIKDDISEAQRARIASFVGDIPEAEIIRFISKEEALKDLRNTLGPQAGVLEGLSVNPLPASFEVAFTDVGEHGTDLKAIKHALDNMDGVEEVQFSEEWLQRFESIISIIRVVGFAIGGLLCLGILFIVTNTIKLTIYSRREEIEILKLVGATDWFVKFPFLLEGIVQGLLSGVIALLILYLGYFILSTKKMYFLGLAGLDFTFIPYEYSLSIVLISVLLGLLGCFIAVGRFFDV